MNPRALRLEVGVPEGRDRAREALPRGDPVARRVLRLAGHHERAEGGADFIAVRDGYPASPSDIFTDGASVGVKALMQLLVRGPHDVVLVPVPQYPLYSAVTTLLNGTLAPYYLDEDAAWGVQEAEFRRALTAAKAGGATTRAVRDQPATRRAPLPRAAVESILRFAAKEKLVLMADEVRTRSPPRNSARNSARRAIRRALSHALLRLCSAQVYQENVYATRRRSSRSRKCCPRWRRRATRRRAACSSCRSTRRPKASSARHSRRLLRDGQRRRRGARSR